jgi:hypothetical protein
MTRTATRVAAAVGATVVMMGLATPALACTTPDSGARSAVVSSDQAKSDQAKGDPGKAFHSGKHAPSLTLAELQSKLDAKIGDKLAWLDAFEAKVAASDRTSDEQKTAFLARLQSGEDALTQLRADVAAATTVDGVHAALKAADIHMFGHWCWNHGNRHHNGGSNGDRNQRNDGGDNNGGINDGGNDRGNGGGFHR